MLCIHNTKENHIFSRLYIRQSVTHNRKNCNLPLNGYVHSHSIKNKHNYYINSNKLEAYKQLPLAAGQMFSVSFQTA
jgi:hypothetical protein